MDLEPAADDRIVGAAADEEEMVGIEDRAIGGAQPPKPVAELFALEFEQPFLTGGQRRTRGGVDDARRDISMNQDRKSTRLNSIHSCAARMPSYACKIKITT